MLERLIGEDVDIAFEPAEGLWATEADPGQVEQILINLAVRTLTVRILERGGYTVLQAEDGAKGMQRAKQHEGRIHLLLTDVVMPLMNGKELHEELTKQHQGLPVLYMSGYTDNAIAHRGVLDTGTRFLPKPFSAEQLLQKVREILDNP